MNETTGSRSSRGSESSSQQAFTVGNGTLGFITWNTSFDETGIVRGLHQFFMATLHHLVGELGVGTTGLSKSNRRGHASSTTRYLAQHLGNLTGSQERTQCVSDTGTQSGRVISSVHEGVTDIGQDTSQGCRAIANGLTGSGFGFIHASSHVHCFLFSVTQASGFLISNVVPIVESVLRFERDVTCIQFVRLLAVYVGVELIQQTGSTSAQPFRCQCHRNSSSPTNSVAYGLTQSQQEVATQFSRRTSTTGVGSQLITHALCSTRQKVWSIITVLLVDLGRSQVTEIPFDFTCRAIARVTEVHAHSVLEVLLWGQCLLFLSSTGHYVFTLGSRSRVQGGHLLLCWRRDSRSNPRSSSRAIVDHAFISRIFFWCNVTGGGIRIGTSVYKCLVLFLRRNGDGLSQDGVNVSH